MSTYFIMARLYKDNKLSRYRLFNMNRNRIKDVDLDYVKINIDNIVNARIYNDDIHINGENTYRFPNINNGIIEASNRNKLFVFRVYRNKHKNYLIDCVTLGGAVLSLASYDIDYLNKHNFVNVDIIDGEVISREDNSFVLRRTFDKTWLERLKLRLNKNGHKEDKSKNKV